MKKFIICWIFLMPVVGAHAEWAKESAADYQLDIENMDATVNADGTYAAKEERVFTALNEKGRNKLALETVSYFPGMMTVKVTSASSVTEGVSSTVDLKKIQDRSAQKVENGISAARELVIPFNNLKIGSMIKYTVEYEIKKPLFPNVFSMRFAYGAEFPEKGGKVVIRSKRKLYSASIDPDHALNIVNEHSGDMDTLTITLIKPQYKVPDEVSASIPRNKLAQVDVSTLNSWEDFVKTVSPGYDQVLATKTLPPALQEIADKARKIQDPYDKIDKVTSELASIMTYSGDWTSPEKMFFPKKLEELGRLKTGDCKDFATATTAILRNLGMKANVSLVHRQAVNHSASQISSQPVSLQVIPADLFNHVIVRVEPEGKKPLWVDPTNIVSNSRFTYSDIATSLTLVLDKNIKAPYVILEPNAEESGLQIERTVKINADNTIDTNGSFEATGEYAKSLAEVAIYKSEDLGQKSVVALYGSNPVESRYTIDGINFKSRIAQKMKAKIKTLGEKSVLSENKGKQYLRAPLSTRLSVFAAAGTHRVTDFYVGTPAVEKIKTHIIGYDFQPDSVGCLTLSPWYEIDRKLIRTKEGFDIVDTISYKKSRVDATEVNSETYELSIFDLAQCAEAQTIHIRPLDKQETLASRNKNANKDYIDKLMKTNGPNSIDAIREAKNLVDQRLAAEPNNREARLQNFYVILLINYKRNGTDRTSYNKASEKILETLYQENPKDAEILQAKTTLALKEDDVANAKKFFSSAYYVSKKDQPLYVLGGKLGEKMKDYRMAKGSYTKALGFSTNPDQIGNIYSSLANVSCKENNVDECISYYKLALQYLATDAWLYSRYVNTLINYRKFDDAIPAAEKMLQIADFGVGRDLLSKAYAGKAYISSMPYAPSYTNMPETERTKVTDLCMKALKYSDKQVACLRLVSVLTLEEAVKNKDADQAEKSLDYATRAVQGADQSQLADLKNLQETAKKVIAGLHGTAADARAPASAGEHN